MAEFLTHPSHHLFHLRLKYLNEKWGEEWWQLKQASSPLSKWMFFLPGKRNTGRQVPVIYCLNWSDFSLQILLPMFVYFSLVWGNCFESFSPHSSSCNLLTDRTITSTPILCLILSMRHKNLKIVSNCYIINKYWLNVKVQHVCRHLWNSDICCFLTEMRVASQTHTHTYHTHSANKLSLGYMCHFDTKQSRKRR